MEPRLIVERDGRRATVRVHGDLVVPTVRSFYARLNPVARRRQVKTLVLDFGNVGRVDSSAVAAISLVQRQLARGGKRLELAELAEHHRRAFALAPSDDTPRPPHHEEPAALERVGESVLEVASGARALGALLASIARQGLRWKQLPSGSVGTQVVAMGWDGTFIVSLLAFLLGTTMGFQGVTQLQRFGAGVFVGDMLGLTMIRELGPLLTAIILAGRTGAAIAAELGTMKVRSEIDALATMGIDPVRFLVLPRMFAITFVGPALALLAMFVGMFGGMVVAAQALDMPISGLWDRIAERIELADFAHGLGKSLAFSWVIGISGCHHGLRTGGDPGSVGQATTRTVVTSILGIIVIDAVFATVTTLVRAR